MIFKYNFKSKNIVNKWFWNITVSVIYHKIKDNNKKLSDRGVTSKSLVKKECIIYFLEDGEI